MSSAEARLPLGRPSTWLVLGPAIGLVLLGVVIISLFASARAVGLVLAITVLIPAGDIVIVAIERGFASPLHLALHGASGTYMAAASAWVLTKGGTP